MIVRTLTDEDLASLAALYKQFWGEDTLLDKMHATFRRLKGNPNYVFLVAEQEDGCMAGSVMGIVCEELYGECRPFMVVEDMIVDALHRRKGVGSSLIRRLEQCAHDRGCSYIIFVTESERVEAHLFYESLGYQPDLHKGFKKHL